MTKLAAPIALAWAENWSKPSESLLAQPVGVTVNDAVVSSGRQFWMFELVCQS